jgi:hypothetical protein
MAKSNFGCGRPECEAFSSIREEVTFGTGFDFMTGYFRDPCPLCARALKSPPRVRSVLASSREHLRRREKLGPNTISPNIYLELSY